LTAEAVLVIALTLVAKQANAEINIAGGVMSKDTMVKRI
jgi:hypothetical protein